MSLAASYSLPSRPPHMTKVCAPSSAADQSTRESWRPPGGTARRLPPTRAHVRRISVRNCGGGGGTTPLFETVRDGPYAWLNEQHFSGTIGLQIGGVLISVYRAR